MSLGGALGFAAAYGPWGRSFWKRFGNPFGPFLNDACRSPLFAPTAQRDLRFACGPNAELAGAAADAASHAARVLRAVRSRPGRAFVLLEHPDSYGAQAADTPGVGSDRVSCRPVANNLTRVVQLCRWR